jgi:hypothetical protein
MNSFKNLSNVPHAKSVKVATLELAVASVATVA